MEGMLLALEKAIKVLLSNPTTHSAIGCRLFISPWISSEWVHIDFDWRQITSLLDLIGSTRCAILMRSRQRSTFYSFVPSTTRSDGNSIVYSDNPELSPVRQIPRPDILGFIHAGGPYTLVSYPPAPSKTNLHQRITSLFTTLPSAWGTKRKTATNPTPDSISVRTQRSIHTSQRSKQHPQSRSQTSD